MPKYVLTKHYWVWYCTEVEADNEEEAWEKSDELPESAWFEAEREVRDANIEEAW